MSSELSEEIKLANWQFLIGNLEKSELHAAVDRKFLETNDEKLSRVLRYHDDPVEDPGEIEFRALMDLWLGQVGLIYLAWLCGYIPDPASTQEAEAVRKILARAPLKRYYEEYYPIAIQWCFSLQLERRLELAGTAASAEPGAFERFAILYERFRDDQDLGMFLDLLDGFLYDQVDIDLVIESFKEPERVGQAFSRRADQITFLDKGIVGMVRFLTFCHDLDQLLELCKPLPVIQSAFWFFYAYWFHEYSGVAEKSIAAVDNAMSAAASVGANAAGEHVKWRLLLERLTSGVFAKALVAETAATAHATDGRVNAWLLQFEPYTRPTSEQALPISGPNIKALPQNANRIVQCRVAFHRMYTVHGFSEKLAPTIHQVWRDHLPESQRGGLYDQPYEQLREDGKSANLKAAMRIPVILDLIACQLQLGETKLSEERIVMYRLDREMETLAAAEHEGWMEERKIAGWTYGPERDNEDRRHPLLIPYNELPEIEKEKDRETIRQYPVYAKLAGLKIAPKPSVTGG